MPSIGLNNHRTLAILDNLIILSSLSIILRVLRSQICHKLALERDSPEAIFRVVHEGEICNPFLRRDKTIISGNLIPLSNNLFTQSQESTFCGV